MSLVLFINYKLAFIIYKNTYENWSALFIIKCFDATTQVNRILLLTVQQEEEAERL